MLEESDSAHALLESHCRRPADHDGATRTAPKRVSITSAWKIKFLRPSGAFPFLAIHGRTRPTTRTGVGEHARVAKAQRERKKVEARFAELKNQIGLRRLRLRRLRFVREQFFLAAAAQNIKRLVRFLSQPTIPTVQAVS